MLWGLFRRRQFPLIKKNDLIEIEGKSFKVKRVKNSTTLHIKDNFVPWWMGFKVYWECWKEYSHFHWRRDRFNRKMRCHPIIRHHTEMLYPYHSVQWSKRAFESKVIGWSVVIRTPLAMIHIAKCSKSCTKDGYESGVRIHWFPTRWSLRLREAEVMYRHTWEWMSFIPKMAIGGLR